MVEFPEDNSVAAESLYKLVAAAAAAESLFEKVNMLDAAAAAAVVVVVVLLCLVNTVWFQLEAWLRQVDNSMCYPFFFK